MALIRSILHMLWMSVTVVPWALALLLASLGPRGNLAYRIAANWLRMVIVGARVILGIRARVTGMENLPVGATSPAILLVKHQSTYETFLMPVLMPHPLAYVFKKELLHIPFFGWGIGRLDMIHIDRTKGNKAFAKVVAQGKKLLARGIWIIMFPEGTRIPRGQQGNYKTGGTRLAVETGAPVIPIAVTSAKCWPRKAFIKRPGVVDVSIGKPIPSAGREPAELMREVETWIEAEMRRLDPEAYP
jgi:1-acyl-sn-glycerol-3-phosphate acyltransferase